jgi:hypothetical protein
VLAVCVGGGNDIMAVVLLIQVAAVGTNPAIVGAVAVNVDPRVVRVEKQVGDGMVEAVAHSVVRAASVATNEDSVLSQGDVERRAAVVMGRTPAAELATGVAHGATTCHRQFVHQNSQLVWNFHHSPLSAVPGTDRGGVLQNRSIDALD